MSVADSYHKLFFSLPNFPATPLLRTGAGAQLSASQVALSLVLAAFPLSHKIQLLEKGLLPFESALQMILADLQVDWHWRHFRLATLFDKVAVGTASRAVATAALFSVRFGERSTLHKGLTHPPPFIPAHLL